MARCVTGTLAGGGGLAEPGFREIADELYQQVRTEALMTARLDVLAHRMGLSRGTGRVVFLDEARRRYDALVRAHQLFLAMVPLEREVLAMMAGQEILR